MQRNQAASDFTTEAHYRNSDEIDLGQLLLDLRARWKLIFLITLAGTLLSVAMALMSSKEYKPSATLTLPKDIYVERFNQQELIALNREELFQRFYQALHSEENFRNFIKQNGFLSILYENYDNAELLNSDRLMSGLTARFNVSITEHPPQIEVSLQHTDESATVKLINAYITDTNTHLVNDFIAQFKQIQANREEQIKQQITLLRQAARYQREQEISRREAINNVRIQRLENEKELVVELAKENRKTQLAVVSEALKIATTLNIENPTPIDEFSASDRKVAANINLTTNQELPLYLMGTKYLKALTDTLLNRKGEAVFLYEINEINKEVKEAKNDPQLVQLKERESDDPYIEELPALVQQLNKLKNTPLNITGVQFYQIDKSASITNKAVKPNRPLIVIFGFIVSGIVALVLVLVGASMDRRKQRGLSR